MNIYGFEKGKETEKAIKHFLGLPEEISKSGQIDAIYNNVTIEIKRKACYLYEGKSFNHYRNVNNVMDKLIENAFYNIGSNKGTALERSDRIAYSIDGTTENTYVLSTRLFLRIVKDEKVAKFYKQGNNKIVRIVPTKSFMQTIMETPTSMRLADWKEWEDNRGKGRA